MSPPARFAVTRCARPSSLRRAGALAAGLALLAAACGDGIDQRAHLTVGTCWEATSTQALHRELIRIAQEIGSVDIDVRQFSYASLDDYLSKNQPHGGREALDLAVVPNEWLGQLLQRGIIGEVPTARVEMLRRRLVGQAVLAVSDADQVLGFPINADVVALVYDPALFPGPPRTLDDLLSAHLPAGVAPIALDVANPAHLAPFVNATQGSLIDRDGNFLWRDADVLAAVERLAPAWQSPDRWLLCHGADVESLQLQLFAEGKLASFVAGPWLLKALEETERPFRVIPIPRPSGAPYPARALVGYQCVVATRESRWGDLALEVAARLLSPEANRRLDLATRRLPVLLSAYESEQAGASPGTFGFLHALEEGQFLPPTAHWSEGFARARERLAELTGRGLPPSLKELRPLLAGGDRS